MEKHTIAILFGGCSPEYSISLQSAYCVITHVDNQKCDTVLLGITKAGEWFCFTGSPDKILDDTWYNPDDCVRAIISPDRKTRGILAFTPDGPRMTRLDAALPVLHGQNGEDGTIQGLLALAGIPVVGCGSLASALCMDKDKAHKIAGMAGIRIPLSFTIKKGVHESVYLEQAEQLAYPLFVKPVKAGSSYGITKVFERSKLPVAVGLASLYDDEIIIEQHVPGFEIGCAILGNDNLVVGAVDEIEIAGEFFDYAEKYAHKTSSIHVPARITKKKAEEATETAKTIYRALGCAGFARVDMFITPSGEIVFNEVNTIPGFTTHSRYPNMLKAIGMAFEDVLDIAIELAVGK